MIKTLSVVAALVAAGPAFAQSGQFTTTNDVVNQMMVSWAEYDAACRGTNPSDGSEGFCGAREYIAWALSENGICLSDSPTPGNVFETCKPESYTPADPLAEIREFF